MILQIAILAVTFADAPPVRPEFVEFRVREGIDEEDRRMTESILKERRRAFDRLVAEVDRLQAAIPRIKSGTLLPGVDPFRKPAPDANGDWHFANREMKAATQSAYNARLRMLRKRVERCAVDPAFATTFVGRPEIGTIGYLPQPVTVTRVVSEIDVLLNGSSLGMVLIEGIDAREIAANQALFLPWAFYVAGTTSYIDGYGARRTIPRLRRFDLGRFIE